MATRRRSRRKSISGNLTDIQKRIRYLETRPAAGRLASKAVATRNLALRAVEEDAVADNAIVRRSIAAAAVGTGQIENDAITSNLLATNSVTTDSIAPNSVTSDEIASGAVGTGELAVDAVTTDKIATGAVTTGELGNDSVTNDKLASNSVNADSIAAGSVGETELASSAVTTDKIANEAVTDAKIDGISGSKIIGGIDGALIVNQSIVGGKLALGTITSLQMAAESIGYTELKDDSVLSDKIFRNSIIGRAGTNPLNGVFHIQNFSIGPDDISNSAITSNKIEALAVTTAKINNLAVTRDKINNSAVGTAQIGEGQVTNSKLGSESITVGKIQGGAGIVTAINSSGVGVSFSSNAATFGRSYTLSVSTGTGSNQLAVGNHTHTSGAVGAHTHNASVLFNSSVISGGAHGHTGQNGSHTHGVTPVGSVTVGSVVTSTLKLKQDISNFTVTDPKNILNLKMKKYKYKNSVRGIQNRYNREWMYGYIAEEVQDLGVEQILAYDKNGDPDGIDYGLLSVLVLELVKVQQSEIDSLKEEIQRLKEVI